MPALCLVLWLPMNGQDLVFEACIYQQPRSLHMQDQRYNQLQETDSRTSSHRDMHMCQLRQALQPQIPRIVPVVVE